MNLVTFSNAKRQLDLTLLNVRPQEFAIKLSTEMYCELALHDYLDSFVVGDSDDSWELTTYSGFLVARAGRQTAPFTLTRHYPCNLVRVADRWMTQGETWQSAGLYRQ